MSSTSPLSRTSSSNNLLSNDRSTPLTPTTNQSDINNITNQISSSIIHNSSNINATNNPKNNNEKKTFTNESKPKLLEDAEHIINEIRDSPDPINTIKQHKGFLEKINTRNFAIHFFTGALVMSVGLLAGGSLIAAGVAISGTTYGLGAFLGVPLALLGSVIAAASIYTGYQIIQEGFNKETSLKESVTNILKRISDDNHIDPNNKKSIDQITKENKEKLHEIDKGKIDALKQYTTNNDVIQLDNPLAASLSITSDREYTNNNNIKFQSSLSEYYYRLWYNIDSDTAKKFIPLKSKEAMNKHLELLKTEKYNEINKDVFENEKILEEILTFKFKNKDLSTLLQATKKSTIEQHMVNNAHQQVYPFKENAVGKILMKIRNASNINDTN